MAKIMSFANQKGGVGKTTTCLNVSTFLALMGQKVLLIDADPQGNATSGLGVEKSQDQNSIYNVIVGSVNINDAIKQSQVNNLDIIPANIDLAGVEVELVYMENRENVVKNILKQVKDEYDFICIDCPPSLGLLTINSLTASNSVMIPIQCEFYALEGLSQLMNTVRLVKKKLNVDLEVEGVVLTMRDSRSNLGQQVANEIRKYFGNKVFNTVIPRNIRLAEAPSHGLPVYLYDKNCQGSLAYKELTEELLSKNKISYKKITKLNNKKKRK